MDAGIHCGADDYVDAGVGMLTIPPPDSLSPTRPRITVLCHGVFEALHPGHLAHLSIARNRGDRLVVSVTPDDQVHKGVGRPIFRQWERATMLLALKVVDEVLVFTGADTAIQAILHVKPDLYCKGGDYEDGDTTGNLERERAAVESVGGTLVIIHSLPVYSSTAIVTGKMLHERSA